MIDETEEARRNRQAHLNELAQERTALEVQFGKGNVWSTDELRDQFEVIGFMAPYVVVKRKSDGKKGSMEFQHSPRFYFCFREDE